MHCRAVTRLLQKNQYIHGASAININFSDSGIFGMSIEATNSFMHDALMDLMDELKFLNHFIETTDLMRAKNVLKMNILMAMERNEDRLEEIARNYMTYGDLTF
jgi:hypothetical protein